MKGFVHKSAALNMTRGRKRRRLARYRAGNVLTVFHMCHFSETHGYFFSINALREHVPELKTLLEMESTRQFVCVCVKPLAASHSMQLCVFE